MIMDKFTRVPASLRRQTLRQLWLGLLAVVSAPRTLCELVWVKDSSDGRDRNDPRNQGLLTSTVPFVLSVPSVPGLRKVHGPLALVAISTLSLCSCQSIAPQRPSIAQTSTARTSAGQLQPAAAPGAFARPTVTRAPSPALRSARSPIALASHAGPIPFAETNAPYSSTSSTPYSCACCAPVNQPHIDEYLCNGGDRHTSVVVKQDWTVQGLHPGDTVVHYDTVSGEVKVDHSNDVCVYAPRFAAVRRVVSVSQHEQHEWGASVDLPVALVQSNERIATNTVLQPLQPLRNLDIAGPNLLREKTRPAGLEDLRVPAGTVGGLLPFEDFLIIRSGRFENSEKARLARRLEAAVAWSHDQELLILIDNEAAVESTNDVGLESVYEYELSPGKPRLRVVKVASSHEAATGDFLDFTIRFDNVGDAVIGNVTVIDRLVTRLEYVDDSQNSSLDADFFTQENDNESLTLRWEIEKPLKVGDGGVIRFRCRVR